MLRLAFINLEIFKPLAWTAWFYNNKKKKRLYHRFLKIYISNINPKHADRPRTVKELFLPAAFCDFSALLWRGGARLKKIKIRDVISASVLVKELGGVTLTDGRSWSSVCWAKGQNENTRKRPGSCVAPVGFRAGERTADWSPANRTRLIARCVCFLRSQHPVLHARTVSVILVWEWTLPPYVNIFRGHVVFACSTRRERILATVAAKSPLYQIAYLMYENSRMHFAVVSNYSIPEYKNLPFCSSETEKLAETRVNLFFDANLLLNT